MDRRRFLRALSLAPIAAVIPAGIGAAAAKTVSSGNIIVNDLVISGDLIVEDRLSCRKVFGMSGAINGQRGGFLMSVEGG